MTSYPQEYLSERDLHQAVATYLRVNYPYVPFRTDFAAGQKMTIGQAKRHKALQSGRAWPDLFIAYPAQKPISIDNGCYYGLFLELKKAGTNLWLKDGSLSSNKHIQEQAAMLNALTDLGYYATFAVGLESAVTIIDKYLNDEY